MNALSSTETFAEFYEAEIRALDTRIRILEAALACIGREAEAPLQHPELSFMAAQRIASVTRQALMVVPADESASSERPPIAQARMRGRVPR